MLNISDIIQIISIIVIVISIIVAYYYSRITVKELRDQLELTVFMGYTKRYSEILQNFPENINYNSFKLNMQNKEEVLKIGRLYYDLCSEEYFLHRNEKIDKKVWVLWLSGISYTVKLNGFKEIWEEIKNENYDDEFVEFIEKLQKS